jgi:hypothetical protein
LWAGEETYNYKLSKMEKAKEIFEKILQEINSKGGYIYDFYSIESFNSVGNYSDSIKKELFEYCLENFNLARKDINFHNNSFVSLSVNLGREALGKIDVLSDDELAEYIFAILKTDEYYHWYPTDEIITHLFSKKINRQLEGLLKAGIEKLITTLGNSYYDNSKKIQKLRKFIGVDDLEVFADEFDSIGKLLNNCVNTLSVEEKNRIPEILKTLKQASGSKPSSKFLDLISNNINNFGFSQFEQILTNWLEYLIKFQIEQKVSISYYGGNEHRYTYYESIKEVNNNIFKGIVWSASLFTQKNTVLKTLISKLAEKCYLKLQGKGPALAGVGNACIYVLANSGLEGISQLSRLKLRIKQSSTQDLIQKYIEEESAKIGVSPEEIEDMSVSNYGLEDAFSKETFGDYQVELKVTTIGKTEIQWSKIDGTLLKSEPSALKKDFAEDLKELKLNISQIQKTLSAQRDRIDRMMIQDRTWALEAFNDYYFKHGLMSFITKQLIWDFQKDNQIESAFFIDNQWVNFNGKELNIDESSTVKLWHPVGKKLEEIIGWRSFLSDRSIKQPIKQAFREVYILTDAELNTRSYSNRMAAHILKQHQFNTLAKMRGWKYSLLGAYDDGRDGEICRINLSKYDLRAEFWINEVNQDDAYNDTGIWHYISTDQVRFSKISTNDIQFLIDIPPLVLSEILRDVDLFVGVASVGNDPEWRDNGGLPQFHNYWQSYSFGDLGELAKTRKEVLERLIPRLKIAKVAQIKDKFLVVNGKLRTYKIHLGSGNILMEPNDQYLCIVPDRNSKGGSTEKLFLPFEGDNVLSIILSKAFLLADDDKIIDTTITRQINA